MLFYTRSPPQVHPRTSVEDQDELSSLLQVRGRRAGAAVSGRGAGAGETQQRRSGSKP